VLVLSLSSSLLFRAYFSALASSRPYKLIKLTSKAREALIDLGRQPKSSSSLL
jgi:hypothetical protein